MALPGGYYVKNPDGSLSGPFYEQQPSPVYTPSVMSAPSPLPQAVAAAPLMPGTGAYFPKSVQEAWDNHFDAFGKQDVEKILLDYDQSSIAKVYNNVDGSKKEFTGIAGIREMFTELFGDLPDLKTLEAPIVEVDEPGKTVFLIWKCPGCGFNTATDTFVFGPDFKIKRQNIVVTKEGKEKGAKEGKAKTKKSGMCAWDLNFHHFCEEKRPTFAPCTLEGQSWRFSPAELQSGTWMTCIGYSFFFDTSSMRFIPHSSHSSFISDILKQKLVDDSLRLRGWLQISLSRWNRPLCSTKGHGTQ